MENNGIHMHCCWECKIKQTPWKIVWQYLKTLNTYLLEEPIFLLLVFYPPKNLSHVHSSFLCHSPKWKTLSVPISGWMSTPVVTYPYNGTHCSKNKRWTCFWRDVLFTAFVNKCNNMEEPPVMMLYERQIKSTPPHFNKMFEQWYPHARSNLKYIRALNINIKTIKTLNRKPRGRVSWHWIWQWFLGCDTKSRGNRRKIGHWASSKIKSFVHQKTLSVEWQEMDGRKYW